MGHQLRMETNPPALLYAWLKKRYPGKRAVNYEAAVAGLLGVTGFHAEAETLRHVACGYKRPGGLLAVAVQTWTKGRVRADALLSWLHYSRDSERVA